MRRAHRETVDVLARFGRDGRLEPCVVVLKDCRAFRIDEVLMASGFDPVHHGKRTARFDIRPGGREMQLFLEHQLENPATGATGAAASRWCHGCHWGCGISRPPDAPALFGVVGAWQDLRAVHDLRGARSERGPFMARYLRGVFPNGCLQGFSDTWRAYLAKASSFRMHGARILPRTGDFLVLGPFWDTWSEEIATDCRPGTHRGEILPRQSARERIRAQSCHRQAPANTPMKNLHNRHLTIVYKALTRNQAEYNKEIGF